MKRLTIYFDGGCRPNPGPMEAAVSARGATHFHDDLGSGDNNEAEWLALLRAVEFARTACASDVLFVGDSAVVIGQASGTAKCRSEHLQRHLEAFTLATAKFERVRLKRVPRSKNLAGIALERRRGY